MENIDIFKLKLVKEKEIRYEVKKRICGPRDFVDYAHAMELQEEPEEVLLMLTLNTKNEVTGVFEVSRGSLSSSIVHPREVFKRALLNNASSICLFHNHPSGDEKPSEQDIDVTTRIKQCGDILNVPLHDHLIICNGSKKYTSLKESGYI